MTINKFKEKIDYLILINPTSLSLEVIKTDNIPDIIEKEIEVRYAPILGFETHKFQGIKLPKKDV